MSVSEYQIFQEILYELQNICHEIRKLRIELQEEDQNQNYVEKEDPVQIVENCEPEKKTQSNSLIINWLLSRSIEVISYREPDEAEHIYDELTLCLGDNFSNLSSLYDKIKQSLSNGETFTLNLSSSSQQEIADNTKFAKKLVDYAFLISKYKDDNPYIKEKKIITAAPQRSGNVINFFTGGWFERYVFLKISFFLKKQGLKYSYLRNPKIRLANEDQFELDLLFMVEDQPLWLECKTGDYQSHIAKYSEFNKKHLKILKERSFLVILDISDKLSDDLTVLHNITVANIDNFLNKISESIGLSDQPVQQNLSQASVNISDPNSLATFLNKKGLRPLPELRGLVIKALLQEMDELSQPTNLTEIKDRLTHRLNNNGISKNKIQDIFNAIVRSACFLNTEEETVRTFNIPVIKLITNDFDQLEAKCMASYARAILDHDLDFFEKNENISLFEEVVGGKVPSLDAITNLCQAGENEIV